MQNGKKSKIDGYGKAWNPKREKLKRKETAISKTSKKLKREKPKASLVTHEIS